MYKTTVECVDDLYVFETEERLNCFEKGSLVYLQNIIGDEIFAVNKDVLISITLNQEVCDNLISKKIYADGTTVTEEG